MTLSFSPWMEYVMTFVFGLVVGWLWGDENLQNKFPDLYRAVRIRQLEEELTLLRSPKCNAPGKTEFQRNGTVPSQPKEADAVYDSKGHFPTEISK